MAKEKVELNGKTVLVTGSPGFIGANLVLRLLKEMTSGLIISLDNMNDYYDPALKEYRLRLIDKAAEAAAARHLFVRGSIADKALVEQLFDDAECIVFEHLDDPDAEPVSDRRHGNEHSHPVHAADTRALTRHTGDLSLIDLVFLHG